MCQEWQYSFEAFAEWALNNGYKDDLTIERIDNNKDYSSDNCKWIPLLEQAKNRRTNLMFSHGGETHNLSEWCNKLGMDYRLVHNRIRRNKWSFERALFEPVHVEKRSRKE